MKCLVEVNYFESIRNSNGSSRTHSMVVDRNDTTAPDGLYLIPNGYQNEFFKNKKILKAANTFFEQTIRPTLLTINNADFSGQYSKLITSPLPLSFNDFKSKWSNANILNDIMFTIPINDGFRSTAISSSALQKMQNYEHFTTYLNLFYRNSFWTNIIKTTDSTQLQFTNVQLNTNLGFLNTPPLMEVSPSCLISGRQMPFQEFKIIVGNAVSFFLKTTTQKVNYSLSLVGISSWTEFAEKCSIDRQIPFFYDPTTNRLAIGALEDDIIDITAENNIVSLLQLEPNQRFICTFQNTNDNNALTHNSCSLLGGTKATNATFEPCSNVDIRGDGRLFLKLKNQCEQYNYIPTSISLSTYQTTLAPETISYISGFGSYFPQEWGTILSLKFNDLGFPLDPNVTNARSIALNYAPQDSNLDVAIAAYIAGANPKVTTRATLGLQFQNIQAFPPSDKSEPQLINFYSEINEKLFFYPGVTLDNKNVKYIDTAIGINSIINDISAALNQLKSQLRMNVLSGQLLYTAISNACSPYVKSGFLTTVTLDNNTTLQPYTIILPKAFTTEQLKNGIYPNIVVVLASVNFAEKITLNLTGPKNG